MTIPEPADVEPEDDWSSPTMAHSVQPASEPGIESFELIGVPGPALVIGVRCSSAHVNDSRSEVCADCGESLVSGDRREVECVRPAAGVLMFSDELSQRVECTIVIGRQPAHDPRVAAGMALGLAIDDRALMLSRVHAEVCLDGWDVMLIDRGSVNGTFIREPGRSWHRLTAEVPELLVHGAEIRFGAVEATFAALPRSPSGVVPQSVS